MGYIKSRPVVMDKDNIRRNLKIEEGIKEFLKTLDNKDNRDKNIEWGFSESYKRKYYDLKRFIEFRNENYKSIIYTYNISKELITDYLYYLQNLKKLTGPDKGKPVSPNTTIAYFQSFMAFVSYLATVNAIREDVYRFAYNNTFINKQRTKIIYEQGYMTREQLVEIYNRTEKYKKKGNYYKYRSIIGLLMHGFRRSEIRSLQWKDISFDTKTANIILYKINKKITVKISDLVMNDLKKHYQSLNIDKQQKTSYVFETSRGNPISKEMIRFIVVELTKGMEDTEGKPITTRTFRKTFVNISLLLNYPLHFVQEYTNHTTEVLQKHYQKIRPTLVLDSSTDYINSYFNYIESGKKEKQKINIDDVLKDEELMGKLTQIILSKMITIADMAGAGIGDGYRKSS